MLSTESFNYYIGYVLHASVTEDPAVLDLVEAGDYYKIIYIKSGTCYFELNQKKYIISGANALCLNERDRLTFHKYPEIPLRILLFRPSVINTKFTPEVLNDQQNNLSSSEGQDMFFLKQFLYNAEVNYKMIPLRAMDSSMLEHKILLFQELLEKQDTISWPCRSRSYLFEILFYLVRHDHIEVPVNYMQRVDGYSKLSAEIISYLQSCYHKKITIEMLADEFHTNRTTLLSDFKKHTGKSINQYLIELRLNMASTMLRDTELSMDEISERTGFNDISYFSKVFKKTLNLTPTEYRRINYHELY